MKTKLLRQLLRVLIYAAGAGAGVTLAFLCVQVNTMTSDEPLSLWVLVLLYAGMGAFGTLAAHLTAPRIVSGWSDAMSTLENRIESVTTIQLVSMAIWLMASLLLASLVTQILQFLGESIFTMALSAILYVVMGVIGLTIGARRTDDMAALLSSNSQPVRKGSKTTVIKMLDASALTDGRIAALSRTGVIEGELHTADFIISELRDQAESSDSARRLRAQRGLDAVKRLQNDEMLPLQVDQTDDPSPIESDVALMSLVRERNATLITADSLMHKAARLAGLRVINVNDLAIALRTVTAAGDVLSVRLSKAGKEPQQGVGYLEDGTMLVVEGGCAHINQTVEVTVTSVLQTSAGRMAFARLNEEDRE